MVLGLIENLGLVCENEGGDDNEVDTGLADEGRITPTIDSINVIQTCVICPHANWEINLL